MCLVGRYQIATMQVAFMQCEKDVGMGLCQYVDLCFHASSLPCLHTFWHDIPTFLMFFFYSYFLVDNYVYVCI